MWEGYLPACSVMSESLQPRGLQPTNSSSVHEILGCHFFLQGIFLTQGSNPHLLCLLNWQVDSLPVHL